MVRRRTSHAVLESGLLTNKGEKELPRNVQGLGLQLEFRIWGKRAGFMVLINGFTSEFKVRRRTEVAIWG